MTPIFSNLLDASLPEIPNFKTWRLINWACGNGKAGRVSTTSHSWDVMLTTWCIKFNSLILAADLQQIIHDWIMLTTQLKKKQWPLTSRLHWCGIVCVCGTRCYGPKTLWPLRGGKTNFFDSTVLGLCNVNTHQQQTCCPMLQQRVVEVPGVR